MPLVAALTRLRRWVLRHADGVIGTGVRNVQIVRSDVAALPDDKCLVVYECLDLVGFLREQVPPSNVPAVASRFGKGPREVWAVYAGTFGSNYDLDTLIDAAARLRATAPDLRVILVGDGPRRERILRTIAQRGLDNVRYLGRLHPTELVKLFQVCDIALSTYSPESTVAIPRKVFDYWAAGLPVVNSLSSELRSILKEAGAGLHYTAGDAISLASAIDSLARDPQARAATGGNSRRLADRFDRRVEYVKLVSLVERIKQDRDVEQPLAAAKAAPPHLAVLISPYDIVPGDRSLPGRFQHFARALLNRGRRVTWIASSFNHRDKRQRSLAEIPSTQGLELQLLPTGSYTKNISFRRELNHIQFAVKSAIALSRVLRRQPEAIVVCSTPPLLTPLLCGLVCRIRRVPFVLDVHDAWPEAFEIFLGHSFAVKPVYLLGRLIRRIAASTSRGATFVSRDYCNYTSPWVENIDVTQLGHPFGEFQRAQSEGWNRWTKRPGEHWVAYIGTVSDNYDLPTAISGCAEAGPNVRLFVAGSGPARAKLQVLGRQLAPDRIEFTGELGYADLANLLARCDVGLVSADDAAHIRLPKKTFDYLAAGLAILTCIRGGEVEKLVLDHEIGAVYNVHDRDSFVDALRKVLSLDRQALRARARNLAESTFDSDKLAESFCDWLGATAQSLV